MEPSIHRAAILTTFVILLLAVAGVAAAGGPSGDDAPVLTTPERTSFGVTVSEGPETTVSAGGASSRREDVEDELDEDVYEPTVVTEPTVGERTKPTGVVPPVEAPGRADDVRSLNAERPGDSGRGFGRPARAGRPLGGAPEERRDEKGLARGEGQPKVTLCHKGKNTLTVGAPAREAHLRHGDSSGECR